MTNEIYWKYRGYASIAIEGISINQFISSAVAEKMSALMTEKYLRQRAAMGNENAFFEAMAKVPDVEPEERDRL